MVAPWDVAKNIINALPGGSQLTGIVDAQITSHTNNRRDADLQSGAANAWKGDRQVIQDEWKLLDPQYHNPAPKAIQNPEAFESWSHERIYKALNGDGADRGVDQREINAGADGWRELTKQAQAAIDQFRTGINSDIDSLWQGRTANAAMAASRDYADDFKKLTVGFQQVANGIDLLQGHLDQAKLSVPPPEKVNVVDQWIGHIPGNGVLKLAQHRANEAESHAQQAMKTYAQGADVVDSQTPILPEPKSPVTKPGGSTPVHGGGDPGPSPNGGDRPPSARTPEPKISETKPPEKDSGIPDSAESGTDSQSTNPQSTQWTTNPQGITPQSTTPVSTPRSYLEDSVGRPDSNKPNLGAYGTPGATGGSRTPGTAGGARGSGKSVPGGRAGDAGSATGGNRGTARAAAAAGRAGMPGMGAPGSRGRGDDDDQHETPDYLVQDRTTELFGEQPRVLPPGGVIGG